MPTLEELSFAAHLHPYRRLIIHGQDIPEKSIQEISPIRAELDYPKLTTFNISNVKITLFDPEGRFVPFNADNFWQEHWQREDVPDYHNQMGYKAPVEIHIGYVNTDSTIISKKIFEGEVNNIEALTTPPRVVITAVDATRELRDSNLNDFGIQRRVLIQEDEDNVYSGRYSLPAWMIPSKNSVSARTSLGNEMMTDVGTIATEGILNPLNYQVSGNAIETEGGPLPDGNLPITIFKDAHRYKHVGFLIKQILAAHNITDYEIDFLRTHTKSPHFATRGRPGTDFEALSGYTETTEGQWRGFIKDATYDADNNTFYMLYGNASNSDPHYLMKYDANTDTWERIATHTVELDSITYPYEMWQLATDDFDTFFILATAHRVENGLLFRGVYDAFETTAIPYKPPIVVLKYVKSTDTWTTVDQFIGGNDPQIGFYMADAPHPNGTKSRYPMYPDTRTVFTIGTVNRHKQLVYRGRSGAALFGVHAYRLDTGEKSLLKSVPAGAERSFDAFIGDTPETTFYAWIENDETTSTIRIDDGNGKEVVNHTVLHDDNPFVSITPPAPLDKGGSGGSAYGRVITISDMQYHDGNLYAVLQAVYGRAVRGNTTGSLIKIEVATPPAPLVKGGEGSIELIKKYVPFLHSARSPVVHNGEVYYFEGSHYQYLYRYNRADDGFPENTGHLIKIRGCHAIDLGLNWRSAGDDDRVGFGRHGGTASPMISDGDYIHMFTGYDNFNVGTHGAPADVNNLQWIHYGTLLPNRIPIFNTNGKKTWDLLNELAVLTNATISYRKGKFSFLPRPTRESQLAAPLSATATTVELLEADGWKESGYLLIDDEIIRFRGRAGNTLYGLVRGQEDSDAEPHMQNAHVLQVDAFAFNHPTKKNLATLQFRPDFLGIQNQLTAVLTPVIGDKADIYLESPISVAANGKKPGQFDWNVLTYHERPWAELLLNEYLGDRQQAQFEVTLTVPWSPHLELGQTLVVDQQIFAHAKFTPVRILQLSHDYDAATTRITGRTFGPVYMTICDIPRFEVDAGRTCAFLLGEYIYGNPSPEIKVAGNVPSFVSFSPKDQIRVVAPVVSRDVDVMLMLEVSEFGIDVPCDEAVDC